MNTNKKTTKIDIKVLIVPLLSVVERNKPQITNYTDFFVF